jgi:hypothetical protein
LLLAVLLLHRYGLPAAAMISLEWWAYEVILILAGELYTAVQIQTDQYAIQLSGWW